MKKIPIIHLVGLLLPVLLAAQLALADTAADLKQAEELYGAGQYTLAEQVYLKVASEADPNDPAEMEAAFNAQRKLPLVYLATDRLPQAKEAVQQLLSRYAQHQSLPHALHELVELAKPVYKLSEIGQVYQDILAAQPGHPQAIWLKMSIAIASVHLGDDQAADAMLQNLTQQHAADERAAEVLNRVAWAYRKLEQYNSALTIYEYVVDNWPQKDRAAFAQHGIVICHLGFRNPQAADAALEVLLQKYGTDPNASKLVLWAAHEYSSAGESKRACEVYESLARNYPDCEELIEAQASLAVLSVQMGDAQRLEAAIQTLLTQFPSNEIKATGLHNVANTLAWKLVPYRGRPPEEWDMLGLYKQCLLAIANYTLATWPRSDWAMWAERDLATVAIHSGDDAAAEAAIRRLIDDYANREDTPAALHFLDNCYLQMKRDDKAESLGQHVAEKYPAHGLVPLVKAGLGQIKLRQGDDAGAEAIFQKVMTDYADHPRLPDAVHLMAEGYRDRAKALDIEQLKQVGAPAYIRRITTEGRPEVVKQYFRRAIEKWEMIIQQSPEAAPATPAAYTFAAECYDCIGDPVKSLEYFNTVAERYPQYEFADYALYMVGRTCGQLRTQGVMTEAQATPMILQAYQSLLDRYPQSEYVPVARKIVERIALTEIRRKEATNEK